MAVGRRSSQGWPGERFGRQCRSVTALLAGQEACHSVEDEHSWKFEESITDDLNDQRSAVPAGTWAKTGQA